MTEQDKWKLTTIADNSTEFWTRGKGSANYVPASLLSQIRAEAVEKDRMSRWFDKHPKDAFDEGKLEGQKELIKEMERLGLFPFSEVPQGYDLQQELDKIKKERGLDK